MAEAVHMLNERNHVLLDINMGCPVPKIVRNGEGSADVYKRQSQSRASAKCRAAITRTPPFACSFPSRRGQSNCITPVSYTHLSIAHHAAIDAARSNGGDQYRSKARLKNPKMCIRDSL